MTFDLVVFDEASQIRVADAVGAMGRAHSAVVVGDSKQMPPTSFAEPSDDGGLAEELLVQPDEESILTEAAQASISKLALTWHYRSRDESLIAFSNGAYYDNRLSSFPAPDAGLDDQGRPAAGVSLTKVDGQFIRTRGHDKGTNRAEADAIVTEIRRRFAVSPDTIPSVGVVTFNMPQRTLIESMLRDLEDQRISDALEGANGEGLFVKNLENVQGDERDVILFSTAFSKNDKNVLPLNFGPLTNRGGERRLNVAITRARTQVMIFTSFDPGDLRVGETGSRGIQDLAAYMHAAAQRTAGADTTNRHPVKDRHRDEIAEKLRQAGVVVETDLGMSDFKIDLALAAPGDPTRPLVAVLLDGEGWAARRTVGDRDGLPVSVLENLMGWPSVERVWMPEWLADPAPVVSRLVAALEMAASRPRGQDIVASPAAPLPVPDNSETAPAPLLGNDAIGTALVEDDFGEFDLPNATEFVPWRPQPWGDRSWLDALPDRRAQERVRQTINEVVEAEGPIALERLARLVASAYDLTRLNAARITSIVSCVPRDHRDEKGFAWPAEVDRSAWKTFRTATTDEPRQVTDIHPQELVNAIVALCHDAHGMTEEETLKETLALFGWRRRTEATVAPVQAALQAALADGSLIRQDNGLIVASS
jgi:hypothetical protein